jgi:hypothetical protein
LAPPGLCPLFPDSDKIPQGSEMTQCARSGSEADAINLGESDSSTTVQRRSWSGGRSEPDLSAAWLARGSFDHARRAGAGYRKLREHDATKPSRSSAGKSVVRFGPRFLQPSMERKSLSALYYCSDFIIVPILERSRPPLRIAICNLFFLNHSPRWHLFRWPGAKNQEGVRQHG